jgi:hypothetical protein
MKGVRLHPRGHRHQIIHDPVGQVTARLETNTCPRTFVIADNGGRPPGRSPARRDGSTSNSRLLPSNGEVFVRLFLVS